MSYALIPARPDYTAVSDVLRESKRFTGEKGKGVFSMPNRNIHGLLQAMDLVGLFVAGDAPPSPHGQIEGSKFESHDGHTISPEEARAIAAGLSDLLANDNDLELLYDILDLGQKASDTLEALLREFVAFNRFAAASGGYVVS